MKLFKVVGLTAVAFLIFGGYLTWKIFYKPNVFLKDLQETQTFLYIPTGANADCVKNLVLEKATIQDELFFDWVMKMKTETGKIYPGKYMMKDSLGNKEFVDLLRAGNRLQVKVTLKFFRKSDNVEEYVANQLETGYDELLVLLNYNDYLKQFGFNRDNVSGMFIPNTYYFYWNTTADQFMKRMYKEYQAFWTPERLQKAKDQGLTPIEAITLASIVDRETNCNSEKPTIAGVYLNRLRKGMPLQADPTVVFAMKDFTIKRVRKGHTKIDSPYNTYVNIGLPPGPICTPATSSINAVLNASKHKYMFFCAKEDFSGYHNFAETFEQHLQFARKFQKELNENDIE